MTERENLFRTLDFNEPGWMPYSRNCLEFIMPSDVIRERPAVMEGEGLDGFGVRWRFYQSANPAANGFTCVPGHEVLEDITRWQETVKFPDIEAMDWARADEVAAGLDRENKASLLLWESGPWERVIALMGHEAAMIAMLTEPEAFAGLMEAITDYKIRLLDKIAEHYRPDMICVLEDVAHARAPFFSAGTYNELIFPHDKRLADAIRAKGITYVYHSCGAVLPLLGEILKLEPKMLLSGLAQNNDQVLMEKLYGDKVCFIGPVNTDILHMEDTTLEQVREEAWRVINTFKDYKNLIFDVGPMYPERFKAFEEVYYEYLAVSGACAPVN